MSMTTVSISLGATYTATVSDRALDVNASLVSGNVTGPEPAVPQPLQWPLLGLLVVIVCTTLGNLLVCLAVCWDRRLQNMTNYFLMSLAIADLLVAIVVMPFGMIVEIYGFFPLGAEFCAFWVTMDVLMCTASIWHMCTMSMDRYFTLKYPMQYGRNKTKTMVAVKIVFVWVISFTISSPICIYALVDQNYVYNEHTCAITIRDFVIYGSIFAFYIPLCIMILTYTLTIRILRQNQHMMRTIERSNFRMRPRQNHHKNPNVTTYLSPPSSDSRRDSHTDISSLSRTPNTILSNYTENELKLLELKNVIDNSYTANISTTIPNGHVRNPHCLSVDSHNNNFTKTSDNLQPGLSPTSQLGSNMSINTLSAIESLPTTPTTLALPLTTVHIQSPSSDDEDETASLLQSRDKLARSMSQSSSSSSSKKFRLRTNTDVGGTKSYLSIHSSLKLPKSADKPSLQSSVSCSNFTNNSDGNKDMFESLGIHTGNVLNRDYKSLEWCHHFYEIQEEMDQCLRESNETKDEITSLAKKPTSGSTDSKGNIESPSLVQKPIIRKDIGGDNRQVSIEITESGDSLDDTSSENATENLNNLSRPKTVQLQNHYKKHINGHYKESNSGRKRLQEEHTSSNAVTRRCNYVRVRDHSSDSDVKHHSCVGDLSDRDKVVRRKAGSIKKFIYKCKNKRGFKNLVSSKTNTNEKKASKVLGIIFAVFVILWTPFFIANILSVMCSSCSMYITPGMMSSFVWMGYVASLANPIIYTMFNTAFRRAFIKILSCHMCTRGPSSFQIRGHPSQIASVVTDRRQTLTVLTNGVHDRLACDHRSSLSTGQ